MGRRPTPLARQPHGTCGSPQASVRALRGAVARRKSPDGGAVSGVGLPGADEKAAGRVDLTISTKNVEFIALEGNPLRHHLFVKRVPTGKKQYDKRKEYGNRNY